MITFSYSQLLGLVAPETILVLTALVVLAVDLLVMRESSLRDRFLVSGLFATVGLIIAGAWLLAINVPAPGAHEVVVGLPMLTGMYVDSALGRLVKVAVLVLTLCTIVMSLAATFTKHVGEYLALILLATVGMLFLISAEDVLMIFIALELTSLSLYILTAFNKRSLRSAEAALKYFLFGGMSAAFMLFGLSYLYGLSGSTGLHEIAARLGGPILDPLVAAAIVMVAIGFGFKIAVAPFHLWAPDTYQGAPTPSAAFIASGSKVASFFVLAKVMTLGLAHSGGSAGWGGYAPGWLPVLAVLVVLSTFLGNLAAIAQTNVKRLLAYSAIAHAGYALLGILANSPAGLTALVFYVITYGLTVLGAFAIVGLVEEATGEARLVDFAGLGRREPMLAFCMLIFLLSLAGIPPLAGFFGKFYLFAAVAAGGANLSLLWLVVFAIAMSAVSLYYYLQVLKQIYVAPSPAEPIALRVPAATRVLLALITLVILVLGCAPNLLLGYLLAAQ